MNPPIDSNSNVTFDSNILKRLNINFDNKSQAIDEDIKNRTNNLTLFHDPPKYEIVHDTTLKPFRYICRVEASFEGHRLGPATGFFIGSRCVITNGHVVFRSGQLASEIKVTPAYTNSSEPFGSELSNEFYPAEEWTVNYSKEWNIRRYYDYAAVILPSTSLYDQIRGFLNYVDAGTLDNLIIIGFPNDSSQMVYSSGNDIDSPDSAGYHYKLDTDFGHSGSPILVNYGNDLLCAGIHTGGDHNANFGVRCTREVAAIWNQWKRL